MPLNSRDDVGIRQRLTPCYIKRLKATIRRNRLRPIQRLPLKQSHTNWQKRVFMYCVIKLRLMLIRPFANPFG